GVPPPTSTTSTPEPARSSRRTRTAIPREPPGTPARRLPLPLAAQPSPPVLPSFRPSAVPSPLRPKFLDCIFMHYAHSPRRPRPRLFRRPRYVLLCPDPRRGRLGSAHRLRKHRWHYCGGSLGDRPAG